MLLGFAWFDRLVERQDVTRHRGDHDQDDGPRPPIFVKTAAAVVLRVAVIVLTVMVAAETVLAAASSANPANARRSAAPCCLNAMISPGIWT